MSSDTTPVRLFGYEVLGHLGDGAGSRIYAVSHVATSQVYALKHVIRHDDKAIRYIEQLECEFAVGRAIRHPNLRSVIDCHMSRSLMLRVTEAALVLELFDGTPLDVTLPPKLSSIIAVFARVADAIHAMHQAGYVHCDLKPGNILVSGEGEVRVIDLGQACRIGTTKTRIQGTPDFMAPEQVRCQPVTPQTDIFNFGATLYWCLTAKKMPTLYNLNKGDNSFLVDTHVPTPAELNPLVNAGLSDFVMDCVRTNPTKRPADMKAFTNRLDVMHHTAVKAEGPPVPAKDAGKTSTEKRPKKQPARSIESAMNAAMGSR